jgi:aminopeptidase 2
MFRKWRLIPQKVFPCFDEPALKATSDITLIANKDRTCLSNMDVLTEEHKEAKETGEV